MDDLHEKAPQILLEHEEKEVLLNRLDMFISKRVQAEEKINRLEEELRSLEVTLSELIKGKFSCLENSACWF